MAHYISESIKATVAERANNKCEYCRMPESDAHFRYHIEHIIAIQHGGETKLDNLAYACSFCNWNKGPNLVTIISGEEALIELFHPRKDDWYIHFEALEGKIIGKTKVGMATIQLLKMNDPDSILIRAALQQAGLYP